MYHDAEFKHALRFTLLLVVVIVPLQFVLAFVMALLVNAKLQRARPAPLRLHPAARRLRPRGRPRVAAIFTEHGYLNTILEAPRA